MDGYCSVYYSPYDRPIPYLPLQAADREDDEDDDVYEETALEGYNTTLDDDDDADDEYVVFKNIMQSEC